jgi:hypothetical protein
MDIKSSNSAAYDIGYVQGMAAGASLNSSAPAQQPEGMADLLKLIGALTTGSTGGSGLNDAAQNLLKMLSGAMGTQQSASTPPAGLGGDRALENLLGMLEGMRLGGQSTTTGAAQQTATPKSPSASAEALRDNYDKLTTTGGMITLQTVNEIASGGKCPDGSTPSPELVAACKDMRDNPAAWKTAETSDQKDLGKSDGICSRDDLDKYIARQGPSTQLKDNFSHLQRDGLISLQTINEVADGENCPDGSKPSAELLAACKQMRDNPALFKATETAWQKDAGKADMQIGMNDLETVLG